MGPASAASTAPTNNDGLLGGVGTLVNGLTTGLGNTLSNTLTPNAVHSSTSAPAGTATPASGSKSTAVAAAAPSSLGSVLEDLPILGPVLKPVVQALPILGGNSSSPTSSAPVSTGSSPATSVPATVHLSTPQAAVPGSTWTKRDTTPASGSSSTDSGGGDSIFPSIPNPLNLLPTSVSAKAEVGAAAVALIILGGVAVAGAAGAAGAAGRRQFVGGPW